MKFFKTILRYKIKFNKYLKIKKNLTTELKTPLYKFDNMGIKDTIVFFGSAMTIKTININSTNDKKTEQMKQYYKDAEELSLKITIFLKQKFNDKHHCIICTGGGPGIMEAANKGAKLANGESIGLNIELPKEQKPNIYQSINLKLTFKYFFMRKYWFSALAKAIIVFPGGFGTLDELFEMYTLITTNKIKNDIIIILYGSDYWNDIINFDKMIEWGTIPKNFKNLIKIFDNVEPAFEYIKNNTQFSKE